MSDDGWGEVGSVGCVLFVILAIVGLCFAGAAHDTSACQTGVFGGIVTRLDYSGGWSSGVLVEFGEAGARVVSARSKFPGVGRQGYVCERNHVHAGEPMRWDQ